MLCACVQFDKAHLQVRWDKYTSSRYHIAMVVTLGILSKMGSCFIPEVVSHIQILHP